MNKTLEDARRWTFAVFDAMRQLDLNYRFCFSGGKDSHVLLGLYFEWMSARGAQLKSYVVFSDTFLETPSLYALVDELERVCGDRGVLFRRVQAPLEQRFWSILMLGYPVPSHFNRWCTKSLKVKPMETDKEIVSVSGSHLGESLKRDQRLNGCGATECGVDLIAHKIEPMAEWRNCQVWDWLMIRGDRVLYPGVFSRLTEAYAAAEDASGSLRMGCAICPVISQKRLGTNVESGQLPPLSLKISELIEELRRSPRIKSPRTKQDGATLVDARIDFWERLQPFVPEMLERGWISPAEIEHVEALLERRAYPPTYPADWIARQELMLARG